MTPFPPGGGKWLANVPADARKAIHKIMRTIDPPGAHRVQQSGYYRWWVRLTPSVGRPLEVVLIARCPDTVDREWPIMRAGRLLPERERRMGWVGAVPLSSGRQALRRNPDHLLPERLFG